MSFTGIWKAKQRNLKITSTWNDFILDRPKQSWSYLVEASYNFVGNIKKNALAKLCTVLTCHSSTFIAKEAFIGYKLLRIYEYKYHKLHEMKLGHNKPGHDALQSTLLLNIELVFCNEISHFPASNLLHLDWS